MSKADALRLPEYLHHIAEAIERIHLYVEDMSEIAFLKDMKTQDAVIRNLEIIGEASRNIERYHKQFADEHDTCRWETPTKCAMRFLMATLRLIWKSSGKPFKPACRNYIRRSSNCSKRLNKPSQLPIATRKTANKDHNS